MSVREKLAVHLFGDKYVTGLSKIFETLEKDELFNNGMNLNDYTKMPCDKKRRLQTMRARRLYEYSFIENGCGMAFSPAFCMIEWSTGMIFSLNKSVCFFSVFFSLKTSQGECYYKRF